MNCTDCRSLLDDYVDGATSARESQELESHLATCVACRAALQSLRRLKSATQSLPQELAPSRDLWPQIATQLQPLAADALNSRRETTRIAEPLSFPSSASSADDRPDRPTPQPTPTPRRTTRAPATLFFLPLAVAATIALLCSFAALHAVRSRSQTPSWSVAALAGAPKIASQPVHSAASLRVGQWLETDASSRAKVAVGEIGEVHLAPNSRLRLVGVASTEHRVELARGTVDALIWAPPRLFFVDTPSATAIDLGCAYTLTVDDDGNGELHVTAGFVALEHGNRESIVPSGSRCVTRRGHGPGIPFTADVSAALRTALNAFDVGAPATRVAAFSEILTLARSADAVTLWHLLARVSSPADRARVFDTLAPLSPPPPDVTRDAIVAGDATARRAWGTALGLGNFATR